MNTKANDPIAFLRGISGLDMFRLSTYRATVTSIDANGSFDNERFQVIKTGSIHEVGLEVMSFLKALREPGATYGVIFEDLRPEMEDDEPTHRPTLHRIKVSPFGTVSSALDVAA
jgi:hypothetical protein